MRAFLKSSGLLFLTAVSAFAHHGAEYITLDDFDIGHPGDGFVNSSFDWESYNTGDELSSEFAFSYTPFHRLSIGTIVRFAEDGNGDWVYSSVTPRLHLQLTDPHADRRFKFALTVGYQFAEDISTEETIVTFEEVDVPVEQERVTTTTTTTVPAEDDGGGTAPCNPLLDLDCRPSTVSKNEFSPRHIVRPVSTVSTTRTTSAKGASTRKEIRRTVTKVRSENAHFGIHNHDARQWVGRLVAETNIGKTEIVANLIGAFPEDDGAHWGYGLGARRRVLEKLAFGLEGIGDFAGEGEHEIISSAFFDVRENATLRIGTGFGLTENSPDFTLRTGLLIRF
ncbi:MAG: hypothetical protein AAGA58_14285 [Verrucomicrobiota bacterium]